jgi:riboflavin synthase alpha subunit
MKRITIAYDGISYTVADTNIDELKTQILKVHTSGTPMWLQVNHGEGSYRETDLLIAPGISVAVTGIDAE